MKYQFEYKIITAEGWNSERALNELGAEGWECFFMRGRLENSLTLVELWLKRQKPI